MTKLRKKFFLCSFNQDLNKAFSKLSSHPYESELGLGFEPISSLNQLCIFRFIEKQTELEEIRDPFGKTQIVETTRYIDFEFEFSSLNQDLVLLSVTNPPPSLKSFIRELHHIFSLDFSISTMQFDVEKICIDIAKLRKFERFLLPTLTASSIPMGTRGSSMDVVIKSPQNAYRDFIDGVSAKKYQIEKFKILARMKGEQHTAEFRRNGTIVYTEDLSSIVVELLQRKGVILRN